MIKTLIQKENKIYIRDLKRRKIRLWRIYDTLENAKEQNVIIDMIVNTENELKKLLNIA